MAGTPFEQWNNFLDLIDEAKEFLLKAEQGEMCLNQLKSLSDRGMEILKQEEAEDKKLQMIMLDMNLMDVLFKIFQLNIRILSPDKFNFDPVVHAHKILHVVKEKDGQNWADTLIEDFSRSASKVFGFKAPSLSVMAGALEITDPEKKAKVRAAPVRLPKDVIEPAKAPEKVDAVKGRTVEETVIEIEKQLIQAYERNQDSSLSYIKFVFNPDSFSKTVENIFHISFLVNSNRASIFLDKDKRPRIKPIPKENWTKSRDSKCALVMSVTPEEWKEAVRLFDVKKPMIILKESDIPDTKQTNASQKRKR
ncbi:Hypothetical predicted protein [Cloeon dipterum]|uniref:Non-structural maintenance of chromosomes element 4 n=1 Tax=Cloeon dipterum TaxID=197152 RepID=A0A8S1D4E6_9INSE|nr:Hypothetical predicted protein [Cloeon dipterum]